MAKYVNEANLQRFWDNIQDQIGSVSQEQVDAWLNAHPEATTTVQDGSVTDPKLVQTGGVLSKIGAYALTSDDCDFGFNLGSVGSDGTLAWSTARIISGFLACRAGDIFQSVSSDYDISVHMYGSDGTYVGGISGGWVKQTNITADGLARVIMRKSDNTTISLAEIASVAANLRVYSGATMASYTKRIYEQNAMVTTRWSNEVYSTQSNAWVWDWASICMQEAMTALYDIEVVADDGYKLGVIQFAGAEISSNNTNTGWVSSAIIPRGATFLISFAKTDNSAISPTESSHITFSYAGALSTLVENKSTLDWVKGGVNADGTQNPPANAMALKSPLLLPTRIELGDNTRSVIRLYKNGKYLGKLNASGGIDKSSGNWRWFYGSVYVTELLREFDADSFDFSLYPTDSTDVQSMTLDAAVAWADAHCSVYVDSHVPIGWLLNREGNYVIGPDFMKRPVDTKLLGTLSKGQAFCFYGGKYYSINGTELAVQDSSFNVEQTVSLNLGHGNSLQIGSNGIAYASGWDDGKVYAVNLSTLAIVDTYTLPTSGYTTVAVDDANGVMYIFQRDSYPDTVAMYNLITYDYVNQQTLSTRKVKSFAAMQGCDYYEGRIIVTYGLGTSTAPSGMFVCNTAGDILAEYNLGIFAASEPEGVCFDRDGGSLLVSKLTTNVGNQVYKVEGI